MLHKSLPGKPDYQQLYNEAAQRADQYQSMYAQAMQHLKEYMRETLQLRKYAQHPFVRSDGSTGTAMQTVWTEPGRMFLHSLFKA